jgi:hypothetical protein
MRVASRAVLLLLTAAGLFAQPTFFRHEEVKVVDQLQYGQATQRLQYTGKPPYLAVHFQGNPGDRVDIRIDSTDGQAAAALTESDYKPIISNFGSHIVTQLPPSAQPYPHEYYIIFQDERKRPATFTVSVQKLGASPEGAAAGYLTCRVDTDCIAVPREGCCNNGYKDAVNREKLAEYRAANACRLKNTICPQFRIEDARVPQCDFASHQCVMVEPNTIRCGGAGDAAHQCPVGFTCKTTGTDIPGICARTR